MSVSYRTALRAAMAGLCLAILFSGCTGKAAPKADRQIAVFVPGVLAGSPIYQMMADGVQLAASGATTSRVSVKVVEGGFNQAEWENQLTTLAAGGSYDLIVSSNPAMPAIAASVAAKFPSQRFLLLDGRLSGNPGIYTFRYNQREQGYLAGYLAALATLEKGGKARRIGLVAGQEYPAMNEVIRPAYLEGARAVDPTFEVDFRVVGNWYDAGKGTELAEAELRAGSCVILAISGGANQGVVQAALAAGAKVIWFDTNGYAERRGTVIGSAVVYQQKAALEKTAEWLAGNLPFGEAETGSVAGGYVDFVQDDPIYIESVSAGLRAKMAALVADLKAGKLSLPAGD